MSTIKDLPLTHGNDSAFYNLYELKCEKLKEHIESPPQFYIQVDRNNDSPENTEKSNGNTICNESATIELMDIKGVRVLINPSLSAAQIHAILKEVAQSITETRLNDLQKEVSEFADHCYWDLAD